MTIKESLADFIGIKAAFAVFQKTKAKTKSQLMSLQLVNITDDKLFFLSHVNVIKKKCLSILDIENFS